MVGVRDGGACRACERVPRGARAQFVCVRVCCAARAHRDDVRRAVRPFKQSREGEACHCANRDGHGRVGAAQEWVHVAARGVEDQARGHEQLRAERKVRVQIIAEISVNLAQHMMPKNTSSSESIGTCWVRSAAVFQHMRLTMGVRKHM